MRKTLPAMGIAMAAFLIPFTGSSEPATAAPAGALLNGPASLSKGQSVTPVTFRKWRGYRGYGYRGYYGYGYYAPRTYWAPPVVRYYSGPAYRVAPPAYYYGGPAVVAPYWGPPYYFDGYYPRRGFTYYYSGW